MTTMTTSTVTEPRDVSLAYVAALNEGRLERLPDLLDDDVVDHHLPPGLPAGIQGVRAWVGMLREALALSICVEDVVASGDRVAIRARITGTHVGDFAGMPATHRRFDAEYLSIERIRDGRIVERWEIADTASISAQLTAGD